MLVSCCAFSSACSCPTALSLAHGCICEIDIANVLGLEKGQLGQHAYTDSPRISMACVQYVQMHLVPNFSMGMEHN